MHHHAYLYEGPASLLPALADSACEKFNFTKENNPDVLVEQWEKFDIDDARALGQQTMFKATGARALFVLGIAQFASSETQHALLKLFEEPIEGTIFVLLLPHGMLIPTLRSRFQEYPEKLESKKQEAAAEGFLAAPYAKRSAWVSEFMKDEENIRERARVFLNELERVLHTKIETSKEVREGLVDIAHFRDYLSDRSPSLKMILEHFAATLPVIK